MGNGSTLQSKTPLKQLAFTPSKPTLDADRPPLLTPLPLVLSTLSAPILPDDQALLQDSDGGPNPSAPHPTTTPRTIPAILPVPTLRLTLLISPRHQAPSARPQTHPTRHLPPRPTLPTTLRHLAPSVHPPTRPMLHPQPRPTPMPLTTLPPLIKDGSTT